MQPLESRRLLATFTVTSQADAGAGSLRDAITQANLNGGADLVRFDPSVTSINLLGQEINVTDDLTIEAPAAGVSVTAGAAARVLRISGGTGGVFLRNLTFHDSGAGNNLPGGAVAVTNGQSLVVEDCRFERNGGQSQGGAIRIFGGSLVVRRSTFTGNVARYDLDNGGAIWAGARVTIEDSTFTGNTGKYGAAVYVGPETFSSLTVSRSTFTSNQAQRAGGAIFGESDVTIDQSTFELNEAILTDTAAGGAVLVIRNATSARPTLTVRESTLTKNFAGRGGAVFVWDGDLNMDASKVTDNSVFRATSNALGGGIYTYRSRVDIRGSAVVGNDATSSDVRAIGGGLFLVTSDRINLTQTTVAQNTAFEGAGVWIETVDRYTTATFSHCTITANHSQWLTGGLYGIAINDDTSQAGLDITASNSIIAGNTAANTSGTYDDFDPDLELWPDGDQQPVPAPMTLTFRGQNLLGIGVASEPSAAGMIFADNPMLGPLTAAGSTLVMAPEPSSPAFNAAVDSLAVDPGPDGLLETADDLPLDFDQTDYIPRLTYGHVDLGASEFALAGDANLDGTVDLADFIIVRNNFGSTSPLFTSGNFDGRGQVDLADFVLLRNNFGQSIFDDE